MAVDGSEVPSVFCSLGSEKVSITDDEIKSTLHSFLDALGPREDVLLLPPDFTRFHSQAGKISRFICEYYNFVGNGEKKDVEPDKNSKHVLDEEQQHTDSSQFSPNITILPALGTHFPMTKNQIETMFGNNLAAKEDAFLVHDWRKDVETIGHAPADMVEKATNGMVSRPWPAQLNTQVWSRRKHDPEKQPHKSLILSVGQVVPHEVMGMANFNKNLFVGVGGVEGKSPCSLSFLFFSSRNWIDLISQSNNHLNTCYNSYQSITLYWSCAWNGKNDGKSFQSSSIHSE